MKKRKAFISIVCIILVIMMILSITVMVIAPTRAYASSSSEIQNEIDSLVSQQGAIQARMQEIQAEIDSLDYEKANTLEKKEYLDRKNQLAQEELNVIQEQIDITDGKISSVQEDLDTARQEETTQRDRWLARLRAMEESSGVGYMEVLFNANSFSDLLTRLDLVNEVMAYDEQLQDEYIAARQNVETLEADAQAMFTENAARRQELETKKSQLEADIAAACVLIAQMEQDTEDYQAVLEQDEATQAAVQALIVQKEDELQKAKAAEEAARLAALAAQQAQQSQQAPPSDSGSGDSGSSGGSSSGESSSPPQQESGSGSGSSSGNSSSGTWMMWPSYTRYLTDHYGPRPVHPVTGKSTFHNGIDIGASYGSSIYAAASGTVVMAQSNGGYGNCVMVNHGNGYTTLYAHMSSISVSYGQSVSQGQVLGLVGATGQVTGPHLHFEVRSSSSGSAMDPMSFSYF